VQNYQPWKVFKNAHRMRLNRALKVVVVLLMLENWFAGRFIVFRQKTFCFPVFAPAITNAHMRSHKQRLRQKIDDVVVETSSPVETRVAGKLKYFNLR
jgi:hypothetical protein